MKKTLSIVLGAMLLLSLAGCGEEKMTLIPDTDEPIVWDLKDPDGGNEAEKPGDTETASDDIGPFIGYWQNDELSQWLLIDDKNMFVVFNDYSEPIVSGIVSVDGGTAKLIDGNGDTYMELDVSESGDLLDKNDMRAYRTATSEPSGQKPEGIDAFAGKWVSEEKDRYIEILSDGTWSMYNATGDVIDEGTASLREDSLVLIDGMGEGVMELERTVSGDLFTWDDMTNYTPVDEIPSDF